jgi:hypothetical protein
LVDQGTTVEIQLTAVGLDKALAAFDALEKRILSLESNTTKSEKKQGDERVKNTQAEEKKKEREYERLAKEAGRWQEKMIRDEARALKQSERENERHFRKLAALGKSAAHSITGAFGSAFSTISRLGGTMLALGGGLSLTNAIGQERDYEKALLQARRHTNMGSKELRDITTTIGRTENLNDVEVTKAFASYATLAGADKAKTDIPEIAKILKSQGMGEHFDDISTGLAKAKVLNPDLDTSKMLRTMLGHGMKEADIVEAVSSEQFGKMMVGAKAIGGPGTLADKQAKQLAMFASLANVEGVGLASQEVSRLPFAVGGAKKAWQKIGLNPLDEHGQVKDIQSLLTLAISKTGGDQAKLRELGLMSARGGGLAAMAGDIYKKAGGGEAGVKALTEHWAEMDHQIKTSEDIQKDHNEVMKNDSEQFDAAMNELQRTIRDHSVPVIKSLTKVIELATPYITRLADGLAELIEWVSTHKWEAAFAGLALLVSKAIVGQILSGIVEKAIAAGFTKLLASASGTSVPASAARVGPGGAAALGLLGTATVAVGVAAGVGKATTYYDAIKKETGSGWNPITWAKAAYHHGQEVAEKQKAAWEAKSGNEKLAATVAETTPKKTTEVTSDAAKPGEAADKLTRAADTLNKAANNLHDASDKQANRAATGVTGTGVQPHLP